MAVALGASKISFLRCCLTSITSRSGRLDSVAKVIIARIRMPHATEPTILVIENDEDIRRLYTDVLSRTGACLLEAGNPYEGFSHLRKHGISLILTDLHMPGGGLEYLATLRRATSTCPIIVITGLGGGDTIQQACLLAGATVFLEKPIRTRQLLEIVDRFLPCSN